MDKKYNCNTPIGKLAYNHIYNIYVRCGRNCSANDVVVVAAVVLDDRPAALKEETGEFRVQGFVVIINDELFS